MNTHPSDHQQVIPVVVTETVQARGEVTTRERHTVQDTSKLARTYVLSGDTVAQKLGSLRAIAATKFISQLELLSYIEDIQSAPYYLETVDAELTLEDDESAALEYLVEEIQR